jgi:hypothetical protein
MPRDPSTEPPVIFAAPWGTRVRLVTVLTILLCVALPPLLRFMLPAKRPAPLPLLFVGPLTGLVILTATATAATVRAYELAPGELRVRRVGRVNRFALAGLVSAEADRTALAGARKRLGNDGLGAVSGTFRSQRLGEFEACVTDAARAVVLRWPDHVLVVSPDRPGDFVDAIRERAGLRR